MAELRAISHDPTCRHLVTLRDGRKMTAVQLQMEYLELARKYTEDRFGADVDEMTADVLDRWESVLTRLAEDPMLLSRELDWVAKLELLEGYRTRDAAGLGHPRLQLVDLQYSDVRPDRGLYNRLAARGRMARLVDDEPRWPGPSTARRTTPGPTSAAAACSKYPDSVAAASWDSVIFDIPGRESLQRVPDPGAAARHQGARRRSAGPLPDRGRAGRRADRPGLTRQAIPDLRVGPGTGRRGYG